MRKVWVFRWCPNHSSIIRSNYFSNQQTILINYPSPAFLVPMLRVRHAVATFYFSQRVVKRSFFIATASSAELVVVACRPSLLEYQVLRPSVKSDSLPFWYFMETTHFWAGMIIPFPTRSYQLGFPPYSWRRTKTQSHEPFLRLCGLAL